MAAPVAAQDALFRPIGTATEISFNIIPLTADGVTPDDGVVFGEDAWDIQLVCDDGTTVTATDITLTEAGDFILTLLDGAMYKLSIPDDAVTSPATCWITSPEDDILIPRSPLYRFDVECLQNGAPVWFRGLVGADSLSTTGLDLSINGDYIDGWLDDYQIAFYDVSEKKCYAGMFITTWVGASSLASLDTVLPVTPLAGDLYFVSHLKLRSTEEALEDLVTTEDFNEAVTDLIGEVNAILNLIGVEGAGLGDIPWNPSWDAEVESEVEDAVGADLTAALADTNELQGDWADGGRLDLILDARASQASVDAIPTQVLGLPTNTAATNIPIFGFDADNNPVTGVSDWSCVISLDAGAASALTDTTVTEVDAGDIPGYYVVDLTQAETNGSTAVLYCTGTGVVPWPLDIEFRE
jgi:hypothetical protein